MDENSLYSENKIRNSFKKVKEDIDTIRFEFNDKFLHLNDKINKIEAILTKIDPKIAPNEDLEENEPFFEEPSIGNERVHQQSTTMINNDQQSTTVNDQQSTNNDQHSQTLKGDQTLLQKELSEMNKDLSRMFRNLTDREFSVFSTIYGFQSRNEEVYYSMLANALNLTEATIRGTVNRLFSKQLPLQKERLFNRKTSLFIKKDFFELNLLNKLISLRHSVPGQKTLLDV